MADSSFSRVRALFDEAMALPPDARAAFVDAAVPASDPLRAEIHALLDAQADKAFMAVPAMLAGRPAAPTGGATDAGTPALDQVGPYRVLREIGRGGMGTVYQATRNDDVFHKVVALKVIGASPEHTSLVERFKRERQILAGVEHPHIARILDGGTTPDGRPYFVMEYVDGLAIDEYCTRVDADVRQRLALVLQVCQALEHLHSQGIVHRDLKPSNIFVTRDGAVKLLDFGIATATAREALDEVSRATILATPGYASPEQLAGEKAGPPSDVYCLGVVLYQLLCGRLPFEDATGRPDLEKQRTTDLPAPPSRPAARASTTQILRAIGPDLDRIVLTALHKEPLRRYPNVQRFADDLRRYLDGRPIGARADSWVYATWLMLARNRLAASLALLLAIAAGTALWMGVTARIDRVRLEANEGEIARLVAMLNMRVERWPAEGSQAEQAAKVADVQIASGLMASETLDEVSARLPDLARVKQLMGELRRFLDRAEERSRNQPPVRKEIALVYRKVGDFESNETKPRVLDRQQATSSYRRAATIVSSVRAADPAWASQQLGEISSRLEGLGTPLDPALLAPASADESASLPDPPKPPPAAVRRLSPARADVDPAKLEDLADRLRSTRGVAERSRTNLAALEARLTSQGQTLRADLPASMRQVDSLLEQAARALEGRDLTAAEELLQQASYELRRLARSVGG